VLYRKGHYGRALEEAIQTQKSQWPTKWTGNPLSGGRSFNTMTAEERVRNLMAHGLLVPNANRGIRLPSSTHSAFGALTRTSKSRP